MKKISVVLTTLLILSCAESGAEKPEPVSKVTITTGSTTITLTAMPKSTAITTITKRREELDKLLTTAVTSGSLSPEKRDMLRAELDRVAQEEAAIGGSKAQAANSKVIGLARSLDDVGAELNIVLKRDVTTPLVQGSHFSVVSGEWIELDDVAIRRWDLEGRVAKLLAAGRITQIQANDIRKQMDVIAERESGMRADGDLDFKESRVLYTDFDKIGRRLESLSKK